VVVITGYCDNSARPGLHRIENLSIADIAGVNRNVGPANHIRYPFIENTVRIGDYRNQNFTRIMLIHFRPLQARA
jgi:hypothetical protein